MVMENSHMLMEVFTKVNGNMVLWTVMVNCTIQVENKLMKVNGKEMLSMVMEKYIMKNQAITKGNLTIQILMS